MSKKRRIVIKGEKDPKRREFPEMESNPKGGREVHKEKGSLHPNLEYEAECISLKRPFRESSPLIGLPLIMMSIHVNFLFVGFL